MIDTKNNVSGELNSNEGLSGNVVLPQTLSGALEQNDIITGTIKDNQEIKGSISSAGGLTGSTSTKQSLGGNIGTSSTGKVNDVRVNGESVVENKIAYIELEDKADKDWVRKFYNSDDINKCTWYSFTGLKTIDNVGVPVSGTRRVNIIEGIYRILDYGLENLIVDFGYLSIALHNTFIPKEDYIDDVESSLVTIDLYNRGKVIIKTRPFGEDYTCESVIVINYLEGWAVKFDENKSELEVLYDTDTSEFIKNTVDNLVNYYNKSETYSKEEVDQLAKSIEEAGYVTEDWVKDQNYMPISDFYDYMNYFYYKKDEVYSKEEIDNKLENLPTGGTELTAGDNTVIEDNAINVYTNTGYKVIDKDIKLQTITDSGTTGTNKFIYANDKEIEFIIDGSDKIRIAENGIDFDIVELPRACKDLLYMTEGQRLVGLCDNGYLIYSDDLGETWTEKYVSLVNNGTYLFKNLDFGKGFIVVKTSNRQIVSLNEDFSQNTGVLTSSIVPNFMARINDTQYVWCNSTGTFKYGAGSREGDFASLSGVTVNMLKRVNDITFLGLKNSNKFYILEPATSVSDYKWIPYTLPSTCTVNDIIYNPYTQIYYIFTDVNTYYKTTNFITFEEVDKNGLRGIQGDFTLMGIQMTTSNHNELLLAPTRTKLENKAQEWDRQLNKSLWVGDGLELTEEGKVNIKISGDNLGVSKHGIYIKQINDYNLPEFMLESIYVAKAELKDNFNPYEFDSWYWEFGVPFDAPYKATKVIFNQAGSFYDQITWAEEYYVEQYEYGYIFCDQNMTIFKYIKLGNLGWFFE